MPTAQNQLPAADQAFQTLLTEAHHPVFFQKLAQAGYEPQTEKDAQDLLNLAGKLRIVSEQQQKQASTRGRFTGAAQALDNLLERNGLGGNVKSAAAQENQLAVNRMARQLSNDPNLYNSVLSLKAAEAEQVLQDLGQADDDEAEAAE